ncbi:asparaginase [Bacillus sp. AK128]
MEKPILVYRGEYIESTHDVHIAVVDHKGKLLYSYGDPYRLTFPRSSMKPFQAVPLVETGTAKAFHYSPKEISLSCASHSGEVFHRETVLDIMARIQLEEDALQCGTHIPRDMESYKQLIKEGKELTPVFSNCSGKHSGMLATAVHMREDIYSYREVEHPVQQRILDAIEEVCQIPKDQIQLSVDGCGVPVHRLPLYNAALGFALLASPEANLGAQRVETLLSIRNAMMEYPEMVGGTNRFDTDVMNAFKGNIVAKAGAEAVQCFGIVENGLGIAIKVEDGTPRATSVVAMEVIRQMGLGDEQLFNQLKEYVHAPVFNARNDKIGVIKANFSLNKR